MQAAVTPLETNLANSPEQTEEKTAFIEKPSEREPSKMSQVEASKK